MAAAMLATVKAAAAALPVDESSQLLDFTLKCPGGPVEVKAQTALGSILQEGTAVLQSTTHTSKVQHSHHAGSCGDCDLCPNQVHIPDRRQCVLSCLHISYVVTAPNQPEPLRPAYEHTGTGSINTTPGL